MTYLFLAVFFAGLLLAVYWMLAGVERGAPARTTGESAGTRPAAGAAGGVRASLTAPVLAASGVMFGATGYILGRYTTLGAVPRLLAAVVAAVVGVVGAVALIRKWAVPAEAQNAPDERYLLQGHLARVTHQIGGGEMGEIVYEFDGTRHASRARSLDDTPVPADTEVVIERIEDGVAYVELWSRVEQRL